MRISLSNVNFRKTGMVSRMRFITGVPLFLLLDDTVLLPRLDGMTLLSLSDIRGL
jgi:hypothetical protein